ncbi:hypothetical protein HMPREF9144_2663 [Prevotella pallens ATCC 700821]|uniref:Uncharacterized protein n=1 Tax=Prevotella pallens ATCC 700821 TaxID=997353 RepID=F9DLX1_9BACT|nr:hypothetical protein HMPREF9144_2663 [Prevotella pallens ATCC 700821]
MQLNTFRINHVWWNVCCQICFALYMFDGMNAAKYVLDKYVLLNGRQ